LASRALRLSKEQDSSQQTRRTKSKSRSRSPTPFDNVSDKPAAKPKPDLAKLFDIHHNRPKELIHSFPFGPVKGVRYHNVQAGRDPRSSPAITPNDDVDRSIDGRTPDGNPKFTAGPSKDQKMRTIAMEPPNRTLMRRVVSNLKTNKSKKRWQMVLDKQDNDVAEEYVIK
jgi:hypothetical protein